MAILKSQLHPKNSTIDVIYPETSLDQVKDYEKTHTHYCYISDDINSKFVIYFQISNNKKDKYILDDFTGITTPIHCFAKVYTEYTKTYEYYEYIKGFSEDSIVLGRYIFDSDGALIEQTHTLNSSTIIFVDDVI